ncbi:TIM barrel protein, partial [Pirellulales bacterium]|nr:TIM barrel protein [Pirellulales bacterium]
MAQTHLFPLGVTAVMLPELEFEEQLALCNALDLTYYVYRPRVIPEERRSEAYTNWGNHRFDLTPDRLVAEGAAVAKQLLDADVVPYCTLPEADTSTSDAEWDIHIRGAVAGGCSRIRISPADHPTELFNYAAHLEQIIARYGELVPRARNAGLKIVIEMHVGNVVCGPGLVHAIVTNFDPAEIGVILDLPNLTQQGYVDPVLAVSVLAPWLDHCHVGAARRVTANIDDAGFRQSTHEFCDLTEGDLNLPTWIDSLAQLKRTLPLIIEDFSPNVTGAGRL